MLKESHFLPRGSTYWNNLITGKKLLTLEQGGKLEVETKLDSGRIDGCLRSP